MLRVRSYDTETTGLELYHGAKMFAWSSCTEGGETYADRFPAPGNPGPGKAATLRGFWHEPGIAVVMHNAKFDITTTENALGEQLDTTPVHDTHKLSHILQNHHQTHTLDHLAWELAGYERVDQKIKQIAAELGGFHKVPPHIMEKYQRLDAERCMCLFLFFWPKVDANPRWRDCYQKEIDVLRATSRMERRGLMLHIERTKRMIGDLAGKAEAAREEIFRLVGKRFNPGSDPQLRKILYDAPPKGLGFPVLKRTEKSGEPALDKHILLALREKTNHPILDAILRGRSYAKGIVTLESYLKLAGPEGVIHPTINTCAAITGRQSSENPNLQNVQKSGKADNPYPVLARHAFRPRPGCINVHLDYAGIEMRLLVHYAKEPEMIAEMNREGGDVHALAAETFYGARFTGAEGEARKQIRYAAKTAAFAIAYGASPQKAAITLGLSPEAGAAAYSRFKHRFPRLAGLPKTIIGWVKERGYVDSVFGRRLHVPGEEAYIGTNYLIQGTAGEVLKRAEICVDSYNRQATGDEVKILLPIHDEIILEYPRSRLGELPGYLRAVRNLMVDFPQFEVPLEIEAEYCTSSWEEKTPLKIPK